MKSAVYFANLRAYSDLESTSAKVQRLFDAPSGAAVSVIKGNRGGINLLTMIFMVPVANSG